MDLFLESEQESHKIKVLEILSNIIKLHFSSKNNMFKENELLTEIINKSSTLIDTFQASPLKRFVLWSKGFNSSNKNFTNLVGLRASILKIEFLVKINQFKID